MFSREFGVAVEGLKEKNAMKFSGVVGTVSGLNRMDDCDSWSARLKVNPNGFDSSLAGFRNGEEVTDTLMVIVPDSLFKDASERGELVFSGVFARTKRENTGKDGRKYDNYDTRLLVEKIQKSKVAG